MRLNLGCGSDIREGYVNVDYRPGFGVDVVCDLNKEPLPFKDGTVDEILLSHVLEHLVEPLNIVLECHRVLKSGGVVHVWLPTNCMGIDHLRYTHGYNYFAPLLTDVSGSLQGGGYFKLDMVQGNRRSWRRIISRGLEVLRSFLVDEYEYVLKKQEG